MADLDTLRADFERKAASLRVAAAELLDHVAGQVDDARFRSAAAALRGPRAGRRQIDDTQALAYARALINTGMAKSIHKACEKAAKLFASPHHVPAMRDRLRRKFGRNN